METGKSAVTSLLVPAETLKQLRGIAQSDRRSVGFVIREAITFWLADPSRQGAMEADRKVKP